MENKTVLKYKMDCRLLFAWFELVRAAVAISGVVIFGFLFLEDSGFILNSVPHTQLEMFRALFWVTCLLCSAVIYPFKPGKEI